MCTHIRANTSASIRIYELTYIPPITHKHASMHTYVNSMQTNTHRNTHTGHIHTRSYMHEHTHTHTETIQPTPVHEERGGVSLLHTREVSLGGRKWLDDVLMPTRTPGPSVTLAARPSGGSSGSIPPPISGHRLSQSMRKAHKHDLDAEMHQPTQTNTSYEGCVWVCRCTNTNRKTAAPALLGVAVCTGLHTHTHIVAAEQAPGVGVCLRSIHSHRGP